MLPHERAELCEEKCMYKEALRWHRTDLAAARGRANDGDEEDERAAGLDLARALRNTGRCLGRLGMRGFAQVTWGDLGRGEINTYVCAVSAASTCVENFRGKRLRS